MIFTSENKILTADGKSAYDIWLETHTGTEADFFAFLRGADGADGVDGQDGQDASTTLEVTSTNTTNTDVKVEHIGGINEINSPTDVTLTVRLKSVEDIPVRTPILYEQTGEGKIIVAYEAGVTGPALQTYAKGQTLTLIPKDVNVWGAVNPPREVGGGGVVPTGVLRSTIEGENIPGLETYINIVGVSQENYNLGTPVEGTLYIIRPDLVPQGMNLFGHVVSGWEVEKSNINAGQPITILHDDWGGNNATGFGTVLPTMEVVNGKKEVRIRPNGALNIGLANNLDFTAGTQDFSLVTHIGSVGLANESLIVGKSPANNENQFGVWLESGYLRGYMSNSRNFLLGTSNNYTPESVLVLTFEKATNKLTQYVNGVQIATHTFSSLTPFLASGDFYIGTVRSNYLVANYSFRGIYFYDEVLTPTNITALTNYLSQ